MRGFLKVLSRPPRGAASGRLKAAPTKAMVIRGPADVDLLYTLFLGRLPESSSAREGFARRSVLEVAETMLTSAEFATQILDGFMLRQWLPHQTLPLDRLSRVAEFIVEAGFARADEAPTPADWKSVLRWTLAGEFCGGVFKDRYGELAEQFLDLLDAPEPPIVSGVDLIANTLCRGWVVDRNNPCALLQLGVKLNGLTVKVIAADEFRRDIQARYGGEGRAGFTIRMDQLPGAGELRQASVEIIELSRGTIVLGERPVELSPAHSRHIEAQLRQELSDLRRAVERLEQDLPRLEDRQTWPLSAYATLQPLVDMVPNPPAPGEAAGSFCVAVIDDPLRPQSASLTLASVLPQAVAADRIFLAVAADAPPRSSLDPGVQLSRQEAGEHPSAALDRIARQTTASHLVVLDAGVTLATEALAWFRAAIGRTGAAVIYSDEEQIARDRSEREALRPVFRPAFDAELLLQRNYIGNFFCISREAFVELGGFVDDPAIDPRHDFLLRAAARYGAGALAHLPLILVHGQSSAADSDAAARARLIRTVECHLERTGSPAQAVAHDDGVGRPLPDAVKIVWPDDRSSTISVIVPTRESAEMVSALVHSLRRHTARWDRLEIVVVVNGSPDQVACNAFAEIESTFERVRVVNRQVPFNWGAINNAAAAELGTGDILVFLNDDMLCMTPDWDIRLRSQLARPDVAVVGGRLLYPNGAIQHAGIVFGHHAQNLHEGAGEAAADGLYLDRTLLVHQTAAVTGAFLACRRDTFESLGGFNAERFTVTCSDVDFCVRARAMGKMVLYDPFLTWIHYESASRGFDDHSESTRRRFDLEFTRWRDATAALDLVDLNLNPHLNRSPRAFEVFHRVDAQAVDTWLAAQQHRCRQSAARLARRQPKQAADEPRPSVHRAGGHRKRTKPAPG